MSILIASTTAAGGRDITKDRKLDIGPVGDLQGNAVATLSYTPLSDREAYVTSIRIMSPSAQDQWNVTIGGRTVLSFELDTVGNQIVTGSVASNNPKVKDFWRWHRQARGCYLTIPVPWGQTLTVASVGAATANVNIEFVEVIKGTTALTDVNHYEGKHFTLPIWAYISASQSAAGEVPFSNQICPAWVPNVFTGVQVQAGFKVDIWALWVESAGVNTYNGSADHRSTTQYAYAIVNGQRKFTRSAAGGIPALGAASAAGSANSVYNSVNDRYHPFQEMEYFQEPQLSTPVTVEAGQTSTWGLSLTGDLTGGASYAHTMLLAACDVTVL